MALNKQDLSQIKKTVHSTVNLLLDEKLKNFATKDDLTGLATEEGLQNVLDYVNENFATKEDIEDIKNSISILPTKNEFISRMDKLSKEVKDMRQKYEVHKHEHARIREKLNLPVVN